MEPQRFAYDSMGARWQVTVWDAVSPATLAELEAEIVAASQAFDETYSRFKRTSLVWELADQLGTFAVPEDLVAMLRLYLRLYDASGRKLNPLVGHAISDLGYDDTYSLTPQETIRSTPDLVEAVRIVDDTHIELRRPGLLDLGSIGKGFFVDRIALMLDAHGMTTYLVDGSGDVRYRGAEPITVGLEDPADATRVIGTMRIAGGAVCASGTNRRRWRDLHHIIDPHESRPTRGILATWAHAETAALADGLASCLFFARPDTLRWQFPMEYCVLYDDRSVATSPGFPGELF